VAWGYGGHAIAKPLPPWAWRVETPQQLLLSALESRGMRSEATNH
jgi:phosphoglycolate phosphatase